MARKKPRKPASVEVLPNPAFLRSIAQSRPLPTYSLGNVSAARTKDPSSNLDACACLA